jgi:hypothetical protein
MKFLKLLPLLAFVTDAAARSAQHVGKKLPERRIQSVPVEFQETEPKAKKRQFSRYMTDQTSSKGVLQATPSSITNAI